MTTAAETALTRYHWASRYVNGLIQGPPNPPPGATTEDIRARALARMDRLRRFLAFIGDPQQRYRSVHVGGTSGKGSTSAFIASILTEAGYRTGLHVSPYLQVETEKLQIDRRLLSGERYADHVAALDRELTRWAEAGNPRLTYGEFWVALTFYVFAREAVDVAVIEVGAGGRFDLTNVLESDVAVITSIGLDHMRTLGGTIPEIAWHKAGIIMSGRPAVTTVDAPDALEVIEREARTQSASLTHPVAGRDYRVLETGLGGTRVLDLPSGYVFTTILPGRFQGANVAAAAAAVRALGGLERGPIDDEAIAHGLELTRFPGRMEIVQRNPLVVLDGAHNPEKMTSFAENVRLLGDPTRRILVLGALDSHDFEGTARIIVPIADEVIVTAPSAVARGSASTDLLAGIARELGKPVEVIPEPRIAVDVALTRAHVEDHVLVTGSLYLVGAVRKRWYRSDDIVVQRTCWPRR